MRRQHQADRSSTIGRDFQTPGPKYAKAMLPKIKTQNMKFMSVFSIAPPTGQATTKTSDT